MWRYAIVVGLVVVLCIVALGCKKQAAAPTTEPTTTPSATPTAGATEITYQCPMHPEVTSKEPGQCTEEGCTEFLVAKAPEGQEVEYVCHMPEMHAEDQVSDSPGKCEKCGMFLKARVKGAEAGEPAAGGEGESGGE